MQMNRKRASELGRETVAVVEAGRYQTATGKPVEIGPLVRRAVEGTETYPPGCELKTPDGADKNTTIQVANETTLVAARQLVEAGYQPDVGFEVPDHFREPIWSRPAIGVRGYDDFTGGLTDARSLGLGGGLQLLEPGPGLDRRGPRRPHGR